MQTFSEHEEEKGYAACIECKDNLHVLQAGFEWRFVRCDQCGCTVVPVSEFDKTMDGAEQMSK